MPEANISLHSKLIPVVSCATWDRASIINYFSIDTQTSSAVPTVFWVVVYVFMYVYYLTIMVLSASAYILMQFFSVCVQIKREIETKSEKEKKKKNTWK